MADAYFLTADSILSTDVAVCLITSDANLLKSQLDKVLSSTEEGLNMEILSEKDTLIYKYTFDEQVITDDVDGDKVKASLEKSLAQQDATMQNVANSLTSYIDQDPIKVRVEYVDADGTTLCKKEYTSGN